MLFRREDRKAAEAVAALCYTNPFTARRIELERQALGPAFVETQGVWSRTSLRFQNPNVASLRERTRGLVAHAHAALEAGHAPGEAERGVYAGVVRYFLFDHFEDELMQLIDAVTAGRMKAEQTIAFYGGFREQAERYFGAGGGARNFADSLARVPHLFAISVQARMAFSVIFQSLLGSSRTAAELRAAVWQSIFTYDMRRYEQVMFARMHEIPTLVLGPSGTGKELVARAIGRCSYVPFDGKAKRFEAPLASDFRALNLTAMSPTLIESELFGHQRGAFTGALAHRAGFFELCTPHGAVFLDEIGELDPGIQVKLLRVLQARRFERVGGTKPLEFQGRAIAATHRDLREQLQTGAFRGDLYFRLCADTVTTPSLAAQLAEAPEDLHAFVEAAVERVLGARQHAETPEARALIDEIIERVRQLGPDYPWPGNVRELEQCVRSFVVKRDYAPLAHAAAAARRKPAPAPAADLDSVLADLDLSAEALLDRYCNAQYRRLGAIAAVARKLGLHHRTVRARLSGVGEEDADGP